MNKMKSLAIFCFQDSAQQIVFYVQRPSFGKLKMFMQPQMFNCVSFEKEGVVYTGNSIIHVCNVKGNAHKYKQFAKQDMIQFK